MRILWLCSTPIKKLADGIGARNAVNVSWIESVFKSLYDIKDNQMGMCFPMSEESKGEYNNIKYYGFLRKANQVYKYNLQTEYFFEKVIKDFKPDIIHIWGTEYSHTLAMVTACEKQSVIERVVISIQGLCSYIERHSCAMLPHKVLKRYTLRDFLRRENLYRAQKRFFLQGENERKALKKCKNVIGRTEWDKACVNQINPEVQYFHCDETMREAFYENRWEYDKCRKHSIFISQGHYPLKGIHFVMEAMYILKKKYSDILLIVGGNKITGKGIRASSYDKYIESLIKRYDLSENIKFLGVLNEKQMCDAYLSANVFVSASSIENSPNSVCEAMLLGTPVVASDVGGVNTLVTHNNDGFLYPYDEAYMMAYYVDKIFSDNDIAEKLSQNAKKTAERRHDKEKNLKDLLGIYDKIIEENFCKMEASEC